MPTQSNTRVLKVGRDARTGKFLSVRVAQRNPRTTVVETYVVPKRRTWARRNRSLRPGSTNDR
jgi:hypothetical protein